jgi:D-lactate dehydrogenase
MASFELLCQGADMAALVAERVELPQNWGCCAFAGDREMLHPELTASATGEQAAGIAALKVTAPPRHSACELGMTRATGEPYRHVLELLEEVTRPPWPGGQGALKVAVAAPQKG